MLAGWLEQGWSDADGDLRRSFDRLLEVEDDRLWEWLLGRSEPEPDCKRIVETIRARHFGPQS